MTLTPQEIEAIEKDISPVMLTLIASAQNFEDADVRFIFQELGIEPSKDQWERLVSFRRQLWSTGVQEGWHEGRAPLLSHIKALESQIAEKDVEIKGMSLLLFVWARLAKALNLSKRNGELADYDDELASEVADAAFATLAWRDDPERIRIAVRTLEKTPDPKTGG